MGIVALTLQVLAGLLVLVAIILHVNDFKLGYGTTMGGEMTTGAAWPIISVAFSISIGIEYHWMAALPTAIATYVVGRLGLHWLIEKVMFKYNFGRSVECTRDSI